MAKNTQNTASKADEANATAAANREAPEIGPISSNVAVPETKSRGRGRGSLYPFEKLTEIGQSFPVMNKTSKGMASVVSNQNRKHRTEKLDSEGNPVPKRDAAGNIVYKTQTVKGEDGTDQEIPTTEPEVEMVNTKKFYCQDVDPKTDPDGASVRVWRIEP